MFAAIAILTSLGLLLGLLLGLAALDLLVEGDPLVEEINAMLPGSNCGQCGFPGCPSGAEALARGEAPVTFCPPGGRALAEALASRLGICADLGGIAEATPSCARIDEENCIGCTRCFKACPTDAIIGGPKQIHTVIRSACTGCSKCIDLCPTECLTLRPIETTLQSWRWPGPEPLPGPAAS